MLTRKFSNNQIRKNPVIINNKVGNNRVLIIFQFDFGFYP